jgi:hypothetical protein
LRVNKKDTFRLNEATNKSRSHYAKLAGQMVVDGFRGKDF